MKILMLLDNGFTNDGRVLREATCLVEAGHHVHLYAMPAKNMPEQEVINGIQVSRTLPVDIIDVKKVRLHQQVARQLAKEEFDVIHAHDQHMVFLGSLVKKYKPGSKLIYDSHELFHAYPLNFGEGISFAVRVKSKVVRYWQLKREKASGKSIDYLVSVTDTISTILKKYFNLTSEPVTVRNVVQYEKVDASSNYLRKTFNIPDNYTVIVHFAHSVFLKKQNLNLLLDQLGNYANTALVFINFRNTPNAKEVETYAADKGYKNVYFHEGIPYSSVHNILSTATLGVVTTYNTTDQSYWLALDNKIFHYIMAEIPIISSAQPEYVNIIEKNDVGVCMVPTEKDAYAKALERVLSNYAHYKQNALRAKEHLHWDAEKIKLIDFYKRIEQDLKK